ncbi:hypothetical protein [Streptomyces werraensis]|uniref:hypothetical protein n=1 Tax=Streptomyces werraensis TaxID=68284 RepID=UPI0036F85A23
MKSKWEPGTRVRVKPELDDALAGLTGTIEEVSYAKREPATSVVLDAQGDMGPVYGLFFEDDELEAAE